MVTKEEKLKEKTWIKNNPQKIKNKESKNTFTFDFSQKQSGSGNSKNHPSNQNYSLDTPSSKKK